MCVIPDLINAPPVLIANTECWPVRSYRKNPVIGASPFDIEFELDTVESPK